MVMLFESVRDFVGLFRVGGVKASDPRVRELMVVLRRAGLTSPQIVELSGGKMSDSLVRQYTRGWGAVDDSLVNEMDALMGPLRELALSGRGVGDVKTVLDLDRSVKARGSSLEEVAELNGYLKGFDLEPGEVGELVTLSRNLQDEFLIPRQVKMWMTLDGELADEGFNKEARNLLNVVCKKFGGFNKVLQAIIVYAAVVEIERRRVDVEAGVKRLEAEAEGLGIRNQTLEQEIRQRTAMINAVNTAALLGFDVVNLSVISALCERFGGPIKVMEAVRKYTQLSELGDELAKVGKERSEKAMLLKALSHKLEEAQVEYERNSDVRLVVELLVNPSDVKQDRDEMGWILARVLECAAGRLEEKPDPYQTPSPLWDEAMRGIRSLAARLRKLTGVIPGGK